MPDKVQCGNFEDLAVLYVAGELLAEERTGIEEHARSCGMCADTLLREMRLCGAILARGEAAGKLDGSGLLLARCRSELAEALDDHEAGIRKPGWRGLLSPGGWGAELRRALAFHPGWSVASLLLAGALGGTMLRAWYREASLPLPGKPVMTVSAAPRLSDRDLETMGIAGIHWEPESSAAPEVEVQMLSRQPVVVQGTPDDAEIRRVLTYVVEHGQRFDPGVRLDSLDVLRTRVADPRVRAALRTAARRDGNPAVRLKAIEALSGFGADPAVQRTILEALAEDDNSGVRIEAVNALLAALGNAEVQAMAMAPQGFEVLRDRERNDPNGYVRLRSARVLSRLASSGAGSALPDFRWSPRP